MSDESPGTRQEVADIQLESLPLQSFQPLEFRPPVTFGPARMTVPTTLIAISYFITNTQENVRATLVAGAARIVGREPAAPEGMKVCTTNA